MVFQDGQDPLSFRVYILLGKVSLCLSLYTHTHTKQVVIKVTKKTKHNVNRDCGQGRPGVVGHLNRPDGQKGRVSEQRGIL